jgi:two-component system, cell cycle sensor histidine kinase and response regulator CckA
VSGSYTEPGRESGDPSGKPPVMTDLMERSMEKAPFGVFAADASGRFFWVNDQACTMTGRSREQLLESGVGDGLDEGGRMAAQALLARVMDGTAGEEEIFFTRPDGSTRTWLIRATGLSESCSVAFCTDITQSSRQRVRIDHLNRLLDSIRDVNRLIARGGEREDLLRETCAIMLRRRGFSYAWLHIRAYGGHPSFFAHSGLPDAVAEAIEHMMSSGEYLTCAAEVLSQGSPVTSFDMGDRCGGCPLLGGSYAHQGAITARLEHAGRVFGVISASVSKEFLEDPQEPDLFSEVADDLAAALYGMDLQELGTRAGTRLRESEERYRLLFNASRIAIFIETIEGGILDCNEAACSMLGYTREELVGMSVADLVPEYLRPRLEGMIRSERDTGGLLVEAENVRSDGTVIPVDVSTRLLETADGTLVVAYVRDITDRKTAEKALVESEERFRVFMESLPAAAFLKDLQGRYLYTNRFMRERHGYGMVGSSTPDCFSPEEADALGKGDLTALEEGVSVCREVVHDTSGAPITYEVYKFKVGESGPGAQLGGIAVDVTERVRAETERMRLEAQIQQTQKLESLGVLAGGIAHDFNNILMAVLGYADLALMDLPSSSPAKNSVMEIEKAAKSAANLARQMLAYSGRGSFVIEQVSINDIIRDMTHLLDISISKKAVIKYRLAEDLPPVNADATQIRQVIMNLITNASEALEDRSGVISITTSAMECDASYLRAAFTGDDLPEGLYSYLEVSDTGCGMSDETRARLFDPFFTTKFTGRGLGLSAVLGIIRGHHGTLRVYTELGRGTSFKILLPACPESLENGTESDGRDGRLRGSERGLVLLVDDEEHVRSVGKAMLERQGFTVITAVDGRDALELFRRSPEGFSFVILDLTMPHMDGEEAFREMRRIRPDVKVILSSGYNEQEVTRKFIGKGLAGFIQKPYKMQELMDRLTVVLNDHGKTGVP